MSRVLSSHETRFNFPGLTVIYIKALPFPSSCLSEDLNLTWLCAIHMSAGQDARWGRGRVDNMHDASFINISS